MNKIQTKEKVAMKILFLSPYPFNKAPSQRLKFEQYYSIFKENGYELTTSSFMDEELWSIIYKKGNLLLKLKGIFKGYLRRIKDIFRVGKFDLVYIHLWTTPIRGAFFEKILVHFSKKMVFDIDDMIFIGHSSNANLPYSFLKGRKKPIYLMKAADHVICGTPSLEEYTKQYNNHTTVIPTTIDTNRYSPKQSYIGSTKTIIGWSGSHSTAKYLLLLKEPLQSLAKEKDFLLKVIGDSSFIIENVKVDSIDWDLDTEREHLLSFDIGLCPMPNEEWVNGKSGGKTLLYMSMGIPTVASDVGPNSSIITNGEDGFLVQNNDEWINTILDLIHNEDLRKKVGMNARKTIEDKYSLHANKNKYLKIFKTLIDQ